MQKMISAILEVLISDFAGETSFYRIRCAVADADKPVYRYYDVGGATVFTVQKLRLATCYTFNVMAQNKLGSSNYMRDDLRSCSLSKCSFSYNFFDIFKFS